MVRNVKPIEYYDGKKLGEILKMNTEEEKVHFEKRMRAQAENAVRIIKYKAEREIKDKHKTGNIHIKLKTDNDDFTGVAKYHDLWDELNEWAKSECLIMTNLTYAKDWHYIIFRAKET